MHAHLFVAHSKVNHVRAELCAMKVRQWLLLRGPVGIGATGPFGAAAHEVELAELCLVEQGYLLACHVIDNCSIHARRWQQTKRLCYTAVGTFHSGIPMRRTVPQA